VSELTRIYNEMGPTERTWIDGFLMGLLFAQAHNDKEGGKQTLETHLPLERWDLTRQEWVKIDNLEKKISAIIYEIDDGGIVSHRFKDEWTVHGETAYKTRVLEIGGSEGHFGSPDWD
jgi:hypothetical protein